MKTRNSQLWFGFLEAGDRSSPVVRDSSLETGNPMTVYLFNLMKGRILEYRRDIVELKLRELSEEESSVIKSLQDAFLQAKEGFTPRGKPISVLSARRRKKPPEPEGPDLDDDDSWPTLDDAGPDLYPAEEID